jgi:CBS domain-containing protein
MHMWDGDCGSIPVRSEAGLPVGIVRDGDIAVAAALPRKTLREITTGEASDGRTVEGRRSVDSIDSVLLALMLSHGRRLPVVDGGGHLQSSPAGCQRTPLIR